MKYYLYSHPTGMRRSFYTLSGIVTNQMGRNVQDGDVFIFINRTCTSMKILHMECGGLVILDKTDHVDPELFRVTVNNMPLWVPAKQKNKAVTFLMQLPLNFKNGQVITP